MKKSVGRGRAELWGNGCVDCDDQHCADDPACRELVCDDSVDNDGDGLTDCEDDDCVDGPPCVEEYCGDGIDNDADGTIDCFDSDCSLDEKCFEDCANHADDNGNGLVDCADPVCEDIADVCIEALNCTDGLDNDVDGLTDCNDPECVFDDVCPQQQGCCLPGGICDTVEPGACLEAEGISQGYGTECRGDVNDNGVGDACEGACCVGDPSACIIMTSADCEAGGGNYHSSGSRCLGDNNGNGFDDVCDPEGACCLLARDCTLATVTECEEFMGIYRGDDVNCEDVECASRGACCTPDHSCTFETREDCSGNYMGDGAWCVGDINGDGYDDTCVPVSFAIPTESHWGLAVLTLLLLTAMKLKFGRVQTQAA